MQNVSNLTIPEGQVRTIHDKDSRLIWGRVAYNTKYAGDTYQQTYSGYNLIDLVPITNTQPTFSQQCTFETVMDATLGRNVLHVTGTNNFPTVAYQLPQRLESGKYYALKFTYRSTVSGSPQSDAMWFAPNWAANYWDVLGSLNSGRAKSGDGDTAIYVGQSTAWKTTSRRFYVVPSQHSSASSSYTNICFSLGYNANATKELWLADAELYEITEDEWNADTYTSKDYEPYTGGIPAPNPDYPQNVQTVTGEQTITISDGIDSEDFSISLGSTELCKIGDYQDYIYRDEDGDWYVHKAINKVILNGSETWAKASVSFRTTADTTPGVVLLANMSGYSNYFTHHYYASGISSNIQNGEFGWSGARILTMRNDDCADADAFKTWLSSHNTAIYYQLATATDTKITDATLIGQLNAVHGWLTRYGYNATVVGDLPIVIDRTNL